MRIIYLFIFFITIGFYSSAKNIYLSNNGNDGNSGTNPSLPWKTLNKLNSFVNLSAGDSVLFKCGDTFYGIININQSGTAGSPIIFSSYGTGARPIITGFTTVSSWTNLGSNIWESSNKIATILAPNIVVINSKIAQMGRYPNTGWVTINTATNNSVSNPSLNTTNWTGAEAVIRTLYSR
jgi:hypothetical protein